MKSLGLIEAERLGLIPDNYWKSHEFCFYLLSQIVSSSESLEETGSHLAVSDAVVDAAEQLGVDPEKLDWIELLRNDEMMDLYYHHIVGHLVLALISDMVQFLDEALRALEKRKFTVAYSLLRKPLKENLLYLTWLLADEAEFVRRFERKSFSHLQIGKITSDEKGEIFQAAIGKLPLEDAFDPILIRDAIYDKGSAHGLERFFQKATHLVTSQGASLRTEDYELNFIFNDPDEDAYFDPLYDETNLLPYILLFAAQVCIELLSRIGEAHEKTIEYLRLVTMGTWQALFLPGRPSITQSLTRSFGDLLRCSHCDSTLRVTKRSAPLFFLHETVECSSCGLLNGVPLYWIYCAAGREADQPD